MMLKGSEREVEDERKMWVGDGVGLEGKEKKLGGDVDPNALYACINIK